MQDLKDLLNKFFLKKPIDIFKILLRKVGFFIAFILLYILTGFLLSLIISRSSFFYNSVSYLWDLKRDPRVSQKEFNYYVTHFVYDVLFFLGPIILFKGLSWLFSRVLPSLLKFLSKHFPGVFQALFLDNFAWYYEWPFYVLCWFMCLSSALLASKYKKYNKLIIKILLQMLLYCWLRNLRPFLFTDLITLLNYLLSLLNESDLTEDEIESILIDEIFSNVTKEQWTRMLLQPQDYSHYFPLTTNFLVSNNDNNEIEISCSTYYHDYKESDLDPATEITLEKILFKEEKNEKIDPFKM